MLMRVASTQSLQHIAELTVPKEACGSAGERAAVFLGCVQQGAAVICCCYRSGNRRHAAALLPHQAKSADELFSAINVRKNKLTAASQS